MRIFITGATGFVGKRLLEKLLADNHQIYCLVRNKSKATAILGEKPTYLEGDLDNFAKYKAEINSCDVVYHLAACVFDSKVTNFFKTNVKAVQALNEILSQSSTHKRVIYLSTVAVVGGRQAMIVEDSPCAPFSPYGKSKLLAEKAFSDLAHENSNISVLIIRAPVIYGPGQPAYVTDFFKKAMSGSITIVGSGKNIRSMCYIDNLVDYLASVLEVKMQKSAEVLIVADKETLTLDEILKNIAQVNGGNLKIKNLHPIISTIGMLLYRSLHVIGYNNATLFVLATATANINCSIEKAVKRFSYSPLTPLLEGLSRTTKWLQKNQ